MKWNDNIPQSQRDGQIKYIETRWSQLSQLSDRFGNEAFKYCFLINAGAAVATLTFIGTSESIRSHGWPWWMLSIYVFGVILIGIAHSVRFHRIMKIFRRWMDGTNTYYNNKRDWEDIVESDIKLSNKSFWTEFFVYLAFICFISGSVLGIFNHDNLNNKENESGQKASTAIPTKSQATARTESTKKTDQRISTQYNITINTPSSTFTKTPP